MVVRQVARAHSTGTSGIDGLLAEARRDSAEFPQVLANHAPMILVALDRMGASQERLEAFVARYRDVNRLVAPPPPRAPIEAGHWTDSLGDRSRETDYRAFFESAVLRLGIGPALATYLPTLSRGIAASALHPLMRLAFGVQRGDPAEVGTALGYWAACYLPLPCATGAAPVTADPGEVLERIGAMQGLRRLPSYDRLWYAIRAAAADPEFAPVVDWLSIDADTLRRVAGTSLALYAATGDFAALHALTGAHWVRLVAAACPEPRVLRHFWQAVAALVPSLGFPRLPASEAVEAWRHRSCPPWPVIEAEAVASDDEHDISLVFSAREEQEVYGDPLYRVVAARRVGLID